MRFVAAMMKHETNTFSPVTTPLASFAIGEPGGVPVSGQKAIEKYEGTNIGIAAYIALAKQEGAELVIPCAGNAAPSGPVDKAAFEHFATSICDAVRKGCDALFLDLHGAMVTEASDDGEGELLRRVRAIAPELLDQPEFPIQVTLHGLTWVVRALVGTAVTVDALTDHARLGVFHGTSGGLPGLGSSHQPEHLRGGGQQGTQRGHGVT